MKTETEIHKTTAKKFGNNVKNMGEILDFWQKIGYTELQKGKIRWCRIDR